MIVRVTSPLSQTCETKHFGVIENPSCHDISEGDRAAAQGSLVEHWRTGGSRPRRRMRFECNIHTYNSNAHKLIWNLCFCLFPSSLLPIQLKLLMIIIIILFLPLEGSNIDRIVWYFPILALSVANVGWWFFFPFSKRFPVFMCLCWRSPYKETFSFRTVSGCRLNRAFEIRTSICF